MGVLSFGVCWLGEWPTAALTPGVVSLLSHRFGYYRAVAIFSDAQAAAFLVARYGGDTIDGVERIAHGEWSRAYGFSRGERRYVIRFSALNEDFLKDRHAAGFASRELPIPALVELGEAFDGYFAISERVDGTYLDELDGPHLRDLLPALFGVLDAARAVDLSATTGYGIWGADGNAPHPSWSAVLLDVASDRPGSRLHGWRARLKASSTGSARFDAAYRELQTLVGACPSERHLVHADLLNYNVLVSGGRVSGVIDWGSAMYGDFVFDVAWFAFWAPWYPAWQGIDFAAEARRHYASIGLEVPDFDLRLRCAQAQIGLDNQAYCAFKGRWADLEDRAIRTLEVLGL